VVAGVMEEADVLSIVLGKASIDPKGPAGEPGVTRVAG